MTRMMAMATVDGRVARAAAVAQVALILLAWAGLTRRGPIRL